MKQSREAISSRSKAASECFCEHLRHTPRDLTLYPYLALAPLERRSAPMDTRAPRAPSIVDSLCWLLWRASVGGLVAPDVCPLVREAAGALPAALRVVAQHEVGAPPFQMGQQVWRPLSRGPGATSQRGYAHLGWSDSPARYMRCSTGLRSLSPARWL